MKQAIKNIGKIVCAYQLGAGSETEARLIRDGKIVRRDDGTYELFSLEAVNGAGEVAQKGDYFKLSSDGYPYPNDRAFFEANHRPLGGDRFEQLPQPLDAWTADDPICPEIAFLMREKGLILDESTPEKFFSAPLWGTQLSAARDAVLIFYSVDYDAQHEVTNADFNFIARREFDQAYTWLD